MDFPHEPRGPTTSLPDYLTLSHMDLAGSVLVDYLSGPYLRGLQDLDPMVRERELQMTRMIIHQVTCGLYQGKNLTIREAIELGIKNNVQAKLNPTQVLEFSINPSYASFATQNPKKRSSPRNQDQVIKKRK